MAAAASKPVGKRKRPRQSEKARRAFIQHYLDFMPAEDFIKGVRVAAVHPNYSKTPGAVDLDDHNPDDFLWPEAPFHYDPELQNLPLVFDALELTRPARLQLPTFDDMPHRDVFTVGKRLQSEWPTPLPNRSLAEMAFIEKIKMDVECPADRVMLQLLADKVNDLSTYFTGPLPSNCRLERYHCWEGVDDMWLLTLSKIDATELKLTGLPSFWFDDEQPRWQNPHVRRMVLKQVQCADLPVLFHTLWLFFPNLADLEVDAELKMGEYGAPVPPEEAIDAIHASFCCVERVVSTARQLGFPLRQFDLCYRMRVKSEDLNWLPRLWTSRARQPDALPKLPTSLSTESSLHTGELRLVHSLHYGISPRSQLPGLQKGFGANDCAEVDAVFRFYFSLETLYAHPLQVERVPRREPEPGGV